MHNPHRSKGIVFVALCCAIATACSSGSGGGMSQGGSTTSTATTSTSTTTTSNTPTYCCSNLGPSTMGVAGTTLIAAGPIAAPPAASFGTAQKQLATPAGPTFDGSSGSYPANVTFPMISTSLQSGSTGISAGPSNTDATLIVTSTSANSSSFQIVVPALNISFTFTNRENIASNTDGITWGFSHVVAGQWNTGGCCGQSLQNSTFFLFGYETPSSAMPAAGTAAFSGMANASVYKSVGANILSTSVSGNANVSANFATGKVTGTLTQMKQWDGFSFSGPQNYLPWNDVSLSANITAGGNRFSGSTAATSAPGTTFSLAGTATGHVDGAFYGPAAQNVGAIWSLSDGSASAIGALTAK